GIASGREGGNAVEPRPVAQFFREPRLADSRLAADQEQPRGAGRGRPPGVEQGMPFRASAHERVYRAARRRWNRLRRVVEVENLAVRQARRGPWCDPELLLQQRSTLLIEVQRRRALAVARVTPHEGAPRLLIERIETQQLLRM